MSEFKILVLLQYSVIKYYNRIIFNIWKYEISNVKWKRKCQCYFFKIFDETWVGERVEGMVNVWSVLLRSSFSWETLQIFLLIPMQQQHITISNLLKLVWVINDLVYHIFYKVPLFVNTLCLLYGKNIFKNMKCYLFISKQSHHSLRISK